MVTARNSSSESWYLLGLSDYNGVYSITFR